MKAPLIINEFLDMLGRSGPLFDGPSRGGPNSVDTADDANGGLEATYDIARQQVKEYGDRIRAEEQLCRMLLDSIVEKQAAAGGRQEVEILQVLLHQAFLISNVCEEFASTSALRITKIPPELRGLGEDLKLFADVFTRESPGVLGKVKEAKGLSTQDKQVVNQLASKSVSLVARLKTALPDTAS